MMLVFSSILFYVVGLLVIMRVLRGLHDRDELMEQTFTTIRTLRGGHSSAKEKDSPKKNHAVQLH